MNKNRLDSKKLASYNQLLIDENILFEHNVIPQMIVNDKRIIIRINKKFIELFGYKPEEILGMHTVIFTPSVKKFKDYEKYFLKTKDGISESVELVYKKSDGSHIWVRLEGNLINQENQETLILWSFIDISKEIEYRNKLEHLAMTDYMTTLYNRRYIMKKASDLFNNISNLSIYTLSIAIIDIDNFKSINDNYGHNIGDKVIISFSKFLKTFATQERIIARWGGEEFIILFFGYTKEENYKITQEICHMTHEIPLKIEKHTVSFTISIGLAHMNKKDINIDALIKHADIALYEAKKSGKNRVITYKYPKSRVLADGGII